MKPYNKQFHVIHKSSIKINLAILKLPFDKIHTVILPRVNIKDINDTHVRKVDSACSSVSFSARSVSKILARAHHVQPNRFLFQFPFSNYSLPPVDGALNRANTVGL